jgi:hypothetical protein
MSPTQPTLPPSPTSAKSIKKPPLLSLATPALAWDDLELGEPGKETNVGEIWNGELIHDTFNTALHGMYADEISDYSSC